MAILSLFDDQQNPTQKNKPVQNHRQSVNDGLDKGERSALEVSDSHEARSPEELEEQALDLHAHSQDFNRTSLAGHPDQIFYGEKRTKRADRHHHLRQSETTFERKEDAHQRIFEMIVNLINQLLADILSAQKKLPHLIQRVQYAVSMGELNEAITEIELVNEQIGQLKNELRSMAAIYFAKGYGLIVHAQRTFKEAFNASMQNAFSEYFLRLGHDPSSEPSANYFAIDLYKDILTITAGEGIEEIEEETSNILTILRKAELQDVSESETRRLSNSLEKIDTIAQSIQEKQLPQSRHDDENQGEEELPQAA